MPYTIRKKKSKYEVVNTETGKSRGVSDTKVKAQSHMRALYAAESASRRKKKP